MIALLLTSCRFRSASASGILDTIAIGLNANTTTIQFMQNNDEALAQSGSLPIIGDSLPADAVHFNWNQLTPIPDKTGFAGSFVGVAGGALLFAGGANFPDGGTPWNGDPKVWYDTVYALDSVNGSWKVQGGFQGLWGMGCHSPGRTG